MLARRRPYRWRYPTTRGLGALTPVQQSIVDRAASLGVDPATALAIARQESNFNPAAVSTKGAVGLFQLMPGTARSVGVPQACIDNPGDASCTDANITGGLTYFKQLLDQYGGDVSTALWAYNAGPGNVTKGVYPSETASYVPAVLGYQSTFAADLAAGGSAPAGSSDSAGNPADSADAATVDYTWPILGAAALAGVALFALT